MTQTNSLSDPHNRPQDSVTVSLLGHATVLINMFGKRIITDPVLFDKIGIKIGKRKIGMKRLQKTSLHISQLPKIDYILLSHAHMDHRDMESLEALTKKIPNQIHIICAKNTSSLLRRIPHIKTVTELDRNETAIFDGITFRGGETKHRGARRPWERYKKYTKGHHAAKGYNSYLIEYMGKKVVFGGDTSFTSAYKELAQNVDIAIMPIGAYDPWERHHCTPEQAIEMALDMQAKHFVPIHFETFRLDKAHLKAPIDRLVKEVSNHPNIRLVINSIGQTFTLNNKYVQ